MNRRGDWCQTATGKAIYPLDLRPDEIDPLDIAHSLALQCRFNGHCKTFYSVADHSLRVLEQVRSMNEDPVAQRWALMHDAAEAYMTDIPRPVRRSIEGWKPIEAAIEEAISKRFGIPLPMPATVKYADGALLATEARDLMAPPPQAWESLPEPVKGKIIPLPWYVAEAKFLKAMADLGLVEKTIDQHRFDETGNRWDFEIISVCGRPVVIEEDGWDRAALRAYESFWVMRHALPKEWDIARLYGWGSHGRFAYDVVPAAEVQVEWIP
jgi:hypothetical protein